MATPAGSTGHSRRNSEETKVNASSGSASAAQTIKCGLIVLAWIALSTSVILFNRDILVTQKFSYPITLTTLHLAYQTVGQSVLSSRRPPPLVLIDTFMCFQCATRILHRFTSLISGKPTYSLLPTNSSSPPHSAPLSPHSEKLNGLDESKEMPDLEKIQDWKFASVEMGWQEYRKMM